METTNSVQNCMETKHRSKVLKLNTHRQAMEKVPWKWGLTIFGDYCFLPATVFSNSKFRRVLHVVCFLLGNSPASEFYMPTFRKTLFHLHRQVGKEWFFTYLPMKMEQTECSETSAYKIQTPGNYPEENIQHTVFSSVSPWPIPSSPKRSSPTKVIMRF